MENDSMTNLMPIRGTERQGKGGGNISSHCEKFDSVCVATDKFFLIIPTGYASNITKTQSIGFSVDRMYGQKNSMGSRPLLFNYVPVFPQ